MSKLSKHQVYDQIKQLYPLSSRTNQLPDFLRTLLVAIDSKITNEDDARYGHTSDHNEHKNLTEKYSILPNAPKEAIEIAEEIVDDLFRGVLRWRSPNLQHNVGASVNTVASAMYALALDENIYSIDDGLAGNTLIAEKAVTNILSKLAGLKSPGAGFFVFGGTATNLYAMKVGLQKAYPKASSIGSPKNIKMFITEEAHFSHRVSANWLGIGTDNVIEITANSDRTSNIKDAELKIRQAIEEGNIISSIMLNGGSTYSHVVDQISDFVALRDRLTEEYGLDYKPHIHVDSVIGWSWLFFQDYDFEQNTLEISPQAVKLIKRQYEAIAEIKYADSWGVDFHKGVGGCPVDCSIIIFNEPQDIRTISKSTDHKMETHQLATELTTHAPSEFTLETSRSAGTGLAALATLRSLGRKGYQRNLANLIESTCVFRESIQNEHDIRVVNDYSLGFSTMVRIYPPELSMADYLDKEFNSELDGRIETVNKYIKAFYKWDFETRISKNIGPIPSFSSSFFNYKGTKVSALKYYPTSPHYSAAHATSSVRTLINQKKKFDSEIWQHTKKN